MDNQKSFMLTIDVEDWFQVENFKQWIPFSSWSSYELRVEKNINRILDLLDSIGRASSGCRSSGKKLHATFFVLGWVAVRLKHLVREIHARGHEIASHGFNHNLYTHISFPDLINDLKDSKKLLEDIIGTSVIGFRAPSFAINSDILEKVKECGYRYDSSYNSFAMHDRYGQLNLDKGRKIGLAYKISDQFYEIPISNLKVCDKVLPMGGGGYFRLLPFIFFKKAVKIILNQEKAYLFYMHPWEIDHKQPRLNKATRFFKFRHYNNLHRAYGKLLMLVKTFRYCRFVTCGQYLKNDCH